MLRPSLATNLLYSPRILLFRILEKLSPASSPANFCHRARRREASPGLLRHSRRGSAVQSAHDISDGGLAVTLAESCFASESSLAGRSMLRPSRRVITIRILRCPPNPFSSANAAHAPSFPSRPQTCPVLEIARQYHVAHASSAKSSAKVRSHPIQGSAVIDSPSRLCATPGPCARTNANRKMSQKLAFADDRFHDECGVFGVFGHPEASNLAISASTRCSIAAGIAGIVSSDGKELHVHRAWRSRRNFQPSVLAQLPGSLAIATRAIPLPAIRLCSTPSHHDRLQQGQSRLGHNGNLTNAASGAQARASRLHLPDQ